MLAIVCPGQGSQRPGFLSPWLEIHRFESRMAWLSACAGIDLVAHGTTSDAATIRDTAVAQPLIVGSGLASLLTLFEMPEDISSCVDACAGHSVGEITAAAAMGVLTIEQAMVFARQRGIGMAKAAALYPTGMSAIVGGRSEGVFSRLVELKLTAANINGAGQIVAAGTMDQLNILGEHPPAESRVIPLQVAGAFHTEHMRPAVKELEKLEESISVNAPRARLISNKDGRIVRDGREVTRRLVSQVSSPVRWDLTMEMFISLGVTGLIEITPAGTLTGLAKRVLRGVETLALKTPSDLEAGRRMIAEHGSAEA